MSVLSSTSVVLAAFSVALLINIFQHDFFSGLSRRPIEKISLTVYSFFAQGVLTYAMFVTINAWLDFILKNTPLSDDWLHDLWLSLMVTCIVGLVSKFIISNINLYITRFFEWLQKKLNE